MTNIVFMFLRLIQPLPCSSVDGCNDLGRPCSSPRLVNSTRPCRHEFSGWPRDVVRRVPQVLMLLGHRV